MKLRSTTLTNLSSKMLGLKMEAVKEIFSCVVSMKTKKKCLNF